MYDGILASLESLKGLCDYMLARLSENLYRNIIWYHIFLDQSSAENVFRFRSCGKTDLDLLEADLYEQIEELELFIEAHRDDKRLIAVSEVNAAPHRSFVDVVLFCPFHGSSLYREKLSCVLFCILH